MRFEPGEVVRSNRVTDRETPFYKINRRLSEQELEREDLPPTAKYYWCYHWYKGGWSSEAMWMRAESAFTRTDINDRDCE